MSDPSEVETLALRSAVDAVRAAYGALDINPRIKAMAIQLCQWDRADPDDIVMGLHPRIHLMVSGRDKQMTLLQAPIRPMWTHYIQDARNALEVVAMTEQEAQKHG